jgi:predicted dehydrogenase
VISNKNNDRPLKIGFIGGGLNSAVGRVHQIASQLDGKWKLVAGCFSRNNSENIKTGESYGIAPDKVYNNWRFLLEKERGQVDAIVILTPTPSHFKIISKCMESEYAVITEKALACSVSEAGRIAKLTESNKHFLAITYNYSGYPMMRELRSLIKHDELGDILHFQVEMPQDNYLRVDTLGKKVIPQSWRLKDLTIPTLFLDLGVHLHQILYYLTGEHPLEVVADHQKFGFFDVVDNLSCLCRYSGGIHGQAWFSKTALGHRNGLRIRIYGNKASAEWFQGHPEELILGYGDGRRHIIDRAADVQVAGKNRYNRFKAGHPTGFIEAFANLYSDIASAVSDYKNGGYWDSDEIFGADLATEGLAMMEAMVRSLDSRKWEKLSH